MRIKFLWYFLIFQSSKEYKAKEIEKLKKE